MKKDDLLDTALHLYRSGRMVTEIAATCNVNRRTIHRWIRQSGARRDDYERDRQARYEEIRKKAEEKATREEQLKDYLFNIGWDMMTNYLPTLKLRNVTDIVKLDKMIEGKIATAHEWRE